jgi:hypothetical protein
MERVWDGMCAEDAISTDVAENGGEDCGRIQRNPRGAGNGPLLPVKKIKRRL